MEVGAHPTSPDKVIVWVERLLPNPPPTATLQKTQPQAAATAAVLTDAKLPNPKACLGWEFVELDMSTGNATGIRPFCVDGTNATGPEGLGEGSASFDIQAQRMWFSYVTLSCFVICCILCVSDSIVILLLKSLLLAYVQHTYCSRTHIPPLHHPQKNKQKKKPSCIPDSQDMNKEGLCYAPTTPSADNAPVTSFPSGTGREYTITSVAYSEALRATVVVAQHIDDQPNALVDTKIFVASESGGSNNSNAGATAVAPPSGWDVVATLPKAYNTLNQAIATSDGKYLLVTLGTGGGKFVLRAIAYASRVLCLVAGTSLHCSLQLRACMAAILSIFASFILSCWSRSLINQYMFFC